jgi:hypothetical protein
MRMGLGLNMGPRVAMPTLNLLFHSQAFDNAAWTKNGASPPVVTANAATAPDSTATAEAVSNPVAGNWLAQTTSGLVAGAVHTFSVYVRSSASGGATNIRLTTNDSAAWNTGLSTKFPLTLQWQRLVLTGVLSGGTAVNCIIGSIDAAAGSDATCTGNFEVWQGQLVTGGNAGPILLTTA